jgi:hypothetical protein
MAVRIRAVATVAAFLIGIWNAAETAQAAFGASKAGCEVTKPDQIENPEGHEDWFIAEDGLFMAAAKTGTYAARPTSAQGDPPRGTYPLGLKQNGFIKGKVPWFRDSSAHGDLKVKVTRRPGGDQERGDYSNHLGPESSVIPGAMRFTRKGCWDVTATSGDATLEATVWVIEVK